MVWYSHPFKNFPQFVVIHTIKGFSIVNETEIDVLTGHYMNSKYMSKSFQMVLYYFFFLMFTYYVCAGSLLLVDFFCSCSKRGLFSSCGARASYCSGFSCCRAQALGHVGFSCCCSRVLEPRLNGCGTLALSLQGMWDFPGPGIELMSPALAGGFFTTEPQGKPCPLPLTRFVWNRSHKQKKKKKRIEKNSFLIPCGSMVRSAGSNNVGKLMLCPHFSDFNKYFSERRPACFNCTQSNSRSSFFCPSHVEMADNPQPFFI